MPLRPSEILRGVYPEESFHGRIEEGLRMTKRVILKERSD